jgi:hypothetical protein
MNPNDFLESVQSYLAKTSRLANTRSADCLEAIATCLRILAATDPVLGAIVWAAVKLCGEGHWLRLARILEKCATDIRLEASRRDQKNQSLDSTNIQKSVSG